MIFSKITCIPISNLVELQSDSKGVEVRTYSKFKNNREFIEKTVLN